VASIDFGDIPELEWGRDCSWSCQPPPAIFCFLIDWESPAQENCWVNVLVGVGNGTWGGMTYGNGNVLYLDSNKVDMFGVCGLGIHSGYNRYAIWANNLLSGRYRLRLICFNYPNFKYGVDYCPEGKPHFWDYVGTPFISDEAFIEIKEDCNDYAKITSVYYLDPSGTHQIQGYQVLNVLTPYHCVTVLTSTLSEQVIPQHIYGRLRPDSISAPTPIRFERWPEADQGSCDEDFMLKHYHYKSEEVIIPKDYFDLSPEEWSNTSRVLECDIFGENLIMVNFSDTSIAEHVTAHLHLDYLNDTTGCFIPLKGDRANFLFMFSDSLGLDESSVVLFNIEDNNEALIYQDTISIHNVHFDTTMFGLPDIRAAVIPIVWNGRNNMHGENHGHIVDPEKDPYTAYIMINPGEDYMLSNSDTVNVVPKLDSVFITHRPYWPPPVYKDSATIYSIVKAQVDDAGVHPEPDTLNYHYYYPDSEDSTITLRRWARTNYLFRSADSIGFAEDNRARLVSPFLPWHTFNWGMLHYQWTVTRDSANNYGTPRIYYYSTDTTAQWGNRWNPTLVHNLDDKSHHRIYIKSKVSNKKLNIMLQSKSSPTNDTAAHKMIFGSVANICDIAETHLGTPYWQKPYRPKLPYTWIDCSGFVTAIKIQDRGYDKDSIYYLNKNSSADIYARGFYLNGDNDTIRIAYPIAESLVTEGDLIALKKRGKKTFGHIVLIEYCQKDATNIHIEEAYIIHARGWQTPEFRQVRKDNLLKTYKPEEGWIYKYLRYAE
jgi:hypothetical protein